MNQFMPKWARLYLYFVGLPAFAVFAVSFFAAEDPFADPTLPVTAFLVLMSAAAIRAYFMMMRDFGLRGE